MVWGPTQSVHDAPSSTQAAPELPIFCEGLKAAVHACNEAAGSAHAVRARFTLQQLLLAGATLDMRCAGDTSGSLPCLRSRIEGGQRPQSQHAPPYLSMPRLDVTCAFAAPRAAPPTPSTLRRGSNEAGRAELHTLLTSLLKSLSSPVELLPALFKALHAAHAGGDDSFQPFVLEIISDIESPLEIEEAEYAAQAPAPASVAAAAAAPAPPNPPARRRLRPSPRLSPPAPHSPRPSPLTLCRAALQSRRDLTVT